MLLQPRKFKWKSKQKNRTTRSTKVSNLHYGCSGVRILQPYRTSAKRIFRFKIFLKKASRKSDFTRRSLWINLFPHLPLTKKPKGMRMGKGAGKLSTWYTYVRGGVFLVEFYNLRPGRASYFAMRIKHKLPVVSRHVEHYSNSIKVYGGQKTNPKFWAIF
jgi:large subunit ribosomal protein L16